MRLRNAWVVAARAARRSRAAAVRKHRTRRPSRRRRRRRRRGLKVDTADGRRRQGRRDARRHRAEERGDQDERRSGLREAEQGAAVPGNLRRRRRRQVARQRVRLREGRPRQLRLRHADRAGEDRPEELPLPSARVRHARRPAARDRQQRSDAAQHPRDAEGQHGVQQRPADPGHEDDAHLRQRRK